MKIDIYSIQGTKSGQAELPASAFEQDWHDDVVARAYLRQLANARRPIAHTMTKGEVSGTNRKPGAQKHGGRARQGQTTNPHMVGGGVAFGPRSNRNFTVGLNRQQSRKALFSMLSYRAKEGQVLAMDDYTAEAKTKSLVALLKKLPITRDVLIVIPEVNANLEKAARNLPQVKVLQVAYLNVRDLLAYEQVLFVGNSLQKLAEVFLK